jgi:hypothetical protein
MKTKLVVLFVVICAIVTLSFTVASVNQKDSSSANSHQEEPVGGFVAEDKL